MPAAGAGQVFGELLAISVERSPRPTIFPVNDRLPYADVSIATVLVVLGVALAAYPWLEGGAHLFAVVAVIAGLVSIAGIALAAARRPRGVVSGEIRA